MWPISSNDTRARLKIDTICLKLQRRRSKFQACTPDCASAVDWQRGQSKCSTLTYTSIHFSSKPKAVISKYSCTRVILFTLVTLFIQFTLSSIAGKLLPQVYILKGAQLGKKNSKTITMSRTPNSTLNNGNQPAFPYHAYIGYNLPHSSWMNVAAPQHGSYYSNTDGTDDSNSSTCLMTSQASTLIRKLKR